LVLPGWLAACSSTSSPAADQNERTATVVAAATQSLAAVGPVDPENGFPLWYADNGGTRLALCLDPADPLCLAPPENVDRGAPIRFPENFPDEAFYWAASAQASISGGGRVDVTLALEAAFLSPVPQAGQRVVFARVRIRAQSLRPGTYRIVHPYGEKTFEVTGGNKRDINFTEDVAPIAENFSAALGGAIGPFLRWDPAVSPAAPPGYLGDPRTLHRVIGSPNGTNFVRVERRNGNRWQTEGSTDRFALTGKVATAGVRAFPRSGTFGLPQTVTLTASETATPIRYTTDGSEPTPTSTEYTGPIAIATTTELRFCPVVAGVCAPVTVERYTIDAGQPALEASPSGGVFAAPIAVTLRATPASSAIVYTLDGSEPTATSSIYAEPIAIAANGTTTLTYRAISADGVLGPVKTELYTLQAARLSRSDVDPLHGFPTWHEDANGLRLELCLDPNDRFCLPPPENVDPSLPIAFPGNFPEEAFWFAAEAEATAPRGIRVLLVLALEAAFANELPAQGDQVSFGRVRIRADNLPVGEYRITHPYGVDRFTVTTTGKRNINFTEDVEPIPGSFDKTLGSRIAPFLSWDPAVLPAAPAGYVGDPSVAHRVVGSPNGTNYLLVERREGASWVQVTRTDLFSVAGKIAPR
jgi:hypothetical protein